MKFKVNRFYTKLYFFWRNINRLCNFVYANVIFIIRWTNLPSVKLMRSLVIEIHTVYCVQFLIYGCRDSRLDYH